MADLTLLLEDRRDVLGERGLIVGFEVCGGGQSSHRNDKEQQKRQSAALDSGSSPGLEIGSCHGTLLVESRVVVSLSPIPTP